MSNVEKKAVSNVTVTRQHLSPSMYRLNKEAARQMMESHYKASKSQKMDK